MCSIMCFTATVSDLYNLFLLKYPVNIKSWCKDSMRCSKNLLIWGNISIP